MTGPRGRLETSAEGASQREVALGSAWWPMTGRSGASGHTHKDRSLTEDGERQLEEYLPT